MDESHKSGCRCHEIKVPPDVCGLRFSSERVANTDHIGYTSRGEMVIVDYDAHGGIVHIELVGNGKPCQEPD